MNWKVTVKQKLLNKIHQKVKLKRLKKNRKKTNNRCNIRLKKKPRNIQVKKEN